MPTTQTPVQAAISAIPCLALVDADSRRQIEKLCTVERFADGQAIFFYGDPGDAIYLVAEGRIEIFTHNNAGKEIALETIAPGAVFGEVAVFNEATRTANAKASFGTVLVRIQRDHVPAALSLCPDLRDAMLHSMAQRLRVSGDNLRHLTTFDINAMKRERLTKFDHLCAKIVMVLGSVPFLVLLIAGFAFWIVFKPLHDTGLNYLSLAVGALSLLVTLLVLLNQKREEKSATVVDAEESFAIRQAAKELQYLHEKLDATLSKLAISTDHTTHNKSKQ